MFYRLMTVENLKRLRGKKIMRGQRISGDYSWFANQEKNRLRAQIRAIDAELACREAQGRLFE